MARRLDRDRRCALRHSLRCQGPSARERRDETGEAGDASARIALPTSERPAPGAASTSSRPRSRSGPESAHQVADGSEIARTRSGSAAVMAAANSRARSVSGPPGSIVAARGVGATVRRSRFRPWNTLAACEPCQGTRVRGERCHRSSRRQIHSGWRNGLSRGTCRYPRLRPPRDGRHRRSSIAVGGSRRGIGRVGRGRARPSRRETSCRAGATVGRRRDRDRVLLPRDRGRCRPTRSRCGRRCLRVPRRRCGRDGR